MLDRISWLLMAGPMSQAMKDEIIPEINSVTASDTIQRARIGIHLTATSPQFTTQK